jgi:hypothetical protein
MPNGGVPIHMLMRPKQGDVVIHCHGGVVRFYSHAEWERGGDREPMSELDEAEARMLMGFLRYWIGDGKRDSLNLHLPGVDVTWDY